MLKKLCLWVDRKDITMQRLGSSIFRSEALEHYIQSREKNILPRITTPPVFFCMWILLGLCAAAITAACLGRVPVYANGSGIVFERDASVLIFLPTSPTHPLHIDVGAPVHLQIGTPVQIINSTIERVETGVLSPADAQKRYGLADKISLLITGPSIAVSVKLGATFPSRSYAGSVVTVQIQVGTASVLSILLGSAIPNGE
jgi:hypothetical protein